jgi:hypothetical protein
VAACLLAAAWHLGGMAAWANDGGPPPGEDYFSDYENPPAGAEEAPAEAPGAEATGPAAEGGVLTTRRARGGVEGMLRRAGLFQGVDISGQNSLTLQANVLKGSQESYESQRWDSGSVVRQSSLHVEGPVWRELAFQADISDSGWGTNYTRWITGYVGHDSALLYGDLDLRLGGNEFVNFSKSTQGWQYDQRLPGGGFARAFYTTEKGITRTQTFIGNDTAGPYFLTYTPVIEGSEAVKVNEDILHFGTDYSLDYDTGQLNFEPVGGQPHIISASDTVTVSYQSSGYGSESPADIYGARAEMPMVRDRLLVGLTSVRQAARVTATARDTVGFQEDVYYGAGSTGPFDTSYRPIIANGTSVVYKGVRQIIDEALVVLQDGSEQVEGVDYDVQRTIGRIEFRRMVPPTSLVRVKYYYDLSTNVDTGDRDLWGLDMAYRASDDLNLTLDYGTSKDASSGSGQAVALSADYGTDRLQLTGEYRNVQPGYEYMDTVGFQTREKGYSVGLGWQPLRGVTVTDAFSDVQSDTGLSFGYSGYGSGTTASAGVRTAADSSDTALDVTARRNALAVSLDLPNLPKISLTRSDMSNAGGDSGRSSYANEGVRADYTGPSSRYSVRTSFNRVNQENHPATATATVTGSQTDQFQSQLSWNPIESVSLSASYARNASSAVEDDDQSHSSNLQFSARWSPSNDFSLDLSRATSRTQGSVSSGLYSSTSAAPVEAAGVPVTTAAETVEPASEDSNDRLGANWRVSDRLSFDFGLSRRRYNSQGSAGYLSNSDQSSATVGASWQPSDTLSLNLSLSSDKTDYTDAERGTVSSRSAVVSSNYRPTGAPWNAGLSLNLQDGSSPTYVGSGRLQHYVMVPTNLADISGQLAYNIREGLTLSASAGLSDYDGGYSVFTKTTGALQVRYQLNRSVNLDLGYRYIRHINKVTEDSLLYGNPGSGESYIANTFSLAFSTSFSGGIGGTTPALGTGGGTGGGPGTFGGYQSGIYSAQGRDGTSGFAQTGSRYATGRLGASVDMSRSGRSGGGLQGRIGDFQRQTGSSGGRSRGGSGRASLPSGGGAPGRGAASGGGSGAALEDWWLLDDNRQAW